MQKKKRNISVHLNLNGLTKSLDSFLFICSTALLGKQHFRGKEGLLEVETYMSFNTEIVHTDPAQRGPITKVTITSRAASFLRSTKLCHSSRKHRTVSSGNRWGTSSLCSRDLLWMPFVWYSCIRKKCHSKRQVTKASSKSDHSKWPEAMDASVITQVPQGSQQSPPATSTELNNQDEAQQSNKKKGEQRITLQFIQIYKRVA